MFPILVDKTGGKRYNIKRNICFSMDIYTTKEWKE